MNFLETHAHPEAQYAKVRAKQYQANIEIQNQLQGNQNLGTTDKKESISAFFGLSKMSQFGLQSVTQQLTIWENSMKGFTERPSLLIKFDRNDHAKYTDFKNYARNNNIKFESFQNDREFSIVVDKQWNEKIHQFLGIDIN